MKQIVVYESGTGFTASYAAWIAQALQCEAKERKKVSAAELAEYDRVIYGGWIMGNMIMGYDKLKASYGKELVVFAVGVTPTGAEVIQTIRDQNKLDTTPFYYFEGGIDQKKLGFLKRNMLKMVSNSIAKKENKTSQEETMMHLLTTSFDHSNRSNIETLVEFCK